MFLIGFMVLRLKCWTISEPCMRERVTKNSICKLIHWPEQYVGGSGVEKIKPLTHQIQKYLSDRVQFAGLLCRSTPGLNNQLYPSSVRSLRFSSDNSWHLLLSSFLSVSWSFYRPSDKLLGTEHSHLLFPFERLNLMFILSVLMINLWSAAGFTKLEILIFDLRVYVFLTSPLRREVD